METENSFGAVMIKRAVFFIFIIFQGVHKGVPLQPEDNLTFFYDVIEDSHGRTFEDKSIHVSYKQVHAIAFIGNWQKGGELGGVLFDQRKAAYSGYIRAREFDRSYQLATDQPLPAGFVAKLQLRLVHILEPEKPMDKTMLWVYGAGFDKYYGDAHYFSAVYYNDPRKSGRFSVLLSNTLATDEVSLKLALVPRSDGAIGYFAIVRYRWLILGYAYTRGFDFATFDRKVLSFGVSMPFDPLLRNKGSNDQNEVN